MISKGGRWIGPILFRMKASDHDVGIDCSISHVRLSDSFYRDDDLFAVRLAGRELVFKVAGMEQLRAKVETLLDWTKLEIKMGDELPGPCLIALSDTAEFKLDPPLEPEDPDAWRLRLDLIGFQSMEQNPVTEKYEAKRAKPPADAAPGSEEG